MGDMTLDPTVGNVAFGSGKDCWGFTLKMFAEMYSKKFGIAQEKMMKKLWGDNYFDAKKKKWVKEEVTKDGRALKRCFVQFILDPIIKLSKACMSMDKEQIQKMMKVMNVTLDPQE